MMEPHRPYSANSDQAYYSDYSPPQYNGYPSFNSTSIAYYPENQRFLSEETSSRITFDFKNDVANRKRERDSSEDEDGTGMKKKKKNPETELKPARQYIKKTEKQKVYL
uniref:Uncharacterized protein n=1 Tax=Caenorhabditis tropicalis TaxID=1561998 RepID=A0A1I7UCU8_9PELO